MPAERPRLHAQRRGRLVLVERVGLHRPARRARPRAARDATYQTSLFAWNVDQAGDNYGELSELHDPVTADYAGQSPMVGFGAGAYLLALYDRGKPGSPTCGAFASEPAHTWRRRTGRR